MAKTLTYKELIERAVDLSELIEVLDIADGDVLEAARKQPKLFLAAVNYRIQQMRKSNQQKSALEVYRSQLATKFRAARKEAGDRVTEGQVQERLLRDKQYLAMQREVDVAEEREEWAKLLLDAYRMRRDALKIMADQMGAELYLARHSEESTKALKNAKKNLEAKYPGKKG